MNRPLNVLLVEDSRVQAKLVVETLPRDGGLISLAVAGRLSEAVAHIAAEPVDVVLLDLVLPDAQDLEAVEAIQLMRPELPIVVMSALGSRLEEAALRAGAQDCIDKGDAIAPPALLRALRYAVIRQEVLNRYAEARRSLEHTSEALADADRVGQMIDRREGGS